MKQGLVNKAIKLIGTVVLASNKPGFNPCDTVGVITDTLYPYFQDIKLGMNKGPYQYYQIKTTNEYPHAALSELEFITDIRYGYKIPFLPLLCLYFRLRILWLEISLKFD